MATLFRNQVRRINPATGKEENAFDEKGKPLFHPKWRTSIIMHDGKRKTITFGTNKSLAQKEADMLEQREREIRNGIRALPTPEDQNINRLIEDVLDEYFAWGLARGGRRNMPWDDEYAAKKKRNLAFWCVTLGFKTLGDVYGIFPKVEKECHKMLHTGNSGKTVSNKVLDLSAFIKWSKKRKYLTEDPLAELGKFDTSPNRIRRAMTVTELQQLLRLCASHRRLLYEVAACSGLREDELRQLEVSMLDREECAIRIPKHIDKGRKPRLQYIPAALMERLVAFIEAGEAKKIYAKTYRYRSKRVGKKSPPANPLLYVPTNSATALKKDLETAGIPFETQKGILDFHALRTAYINFVLKAAPDVKTAQELARHETADLTLNTYGRAEEERCRAVVESVGDLVFQGGVGSDVSNVCHPESTSIPQVPVDSVEGKEITPGVAGGYPDENLVRKRGLEPP